jgi:hypothetical protein
MNLTAAQLTSFLQAGQAKIGTEVSSEIDKKGSFQDVSIAWEEHRMAWRFVGGLGLMNVRSQGDDLRLGIRQTHAHAVPRVFGQAALTLFRGFSLGLETNLLLGKGANFEFPARSSTAFSIHLGTFLEYRWMLGKWGVLTFLATQQDFSESQRRISWVSGGFGFTYVLSGSSAASGSSAG